MAFRALNAVMALLFLVAVVVQYNDPDPIRWMATYGAACIASLMVARRRPVHPAILLAVAAVALVWSVAIIFGGPRATDYRYMFDEWEMQSLNVEAAREATGLLIVVAWMTVFVIRGKRAN